MFFSFFQERKKFFEEKTNPKSNEIKSKREEGGSHAGTCEADETRRTQKLKWWMDKKSRLLNAPLQ